MATETQKFYFLAPTRETPPSTSIKLGNIITHPRSSDDPLNNPPLPIDRTEMEVHPTVTRDYKVKIDAKTSWTIGIWASFLMQIVGLGGDVEAERSNTDAEEWDCERLETAWFKPTSRYIAESLKHSAVEDFLKQDRTWLRNSKVYMITGIKIAYGASGVITYAKKRGLKLHLGVDATNMGVPVQGGPDIGVAKEGSVKQEFGDKDPFVLAFRMQRIKVGVKGDFTSTAVTGGVLHLGDRSKGEEEVELNVEGLEDEDADADEFDIEDSWEVDDALTAEHVGCAKPVDD